jgi:hypothetical protein
MKLRISGWCRLSYFVFFVMASVMVACTAGPAGRTSGLKVRPSNVQIGKASYNQRTRGFEKPWPFGQLAGPGVDNN